MRLKTKKVDKGIRYLSDWKDFNTLPQNEHYILNKDICGCGATEAFIKSNRPLIIAMPRKHLLFNKYSQHIGEDIFLYRFINQDQYFSEKEPTKEDLAEFDRRFIDYLRSSGSKILTTYDSLDKLTRLMKQEGTDFTRYQVVVDEFQQIIGDSPFKPTIEHQFYIALKKFNSVVYLSATPFLKSYLEMTDQFKDLLMIQLEWPEESISRPDVHIGKLTESITNKCCEIIKDYKSGNFPSTMVGEKRAESKEAVFFLNDVKGIINVIKKAGLEPEEVNILCAPRKENYKQINKLNDGRGVGKSQFTRGSIPAEGENHKMFTFCTSTVYIGADFYSTCAYSYIFANPNVESLTIDVATDLQQILGRQRLDENPFKNKADLFYYLKKPLITEDEMDKRIENKRQETQRHIENFEGAKHKANQLCAMEALIKKGHETQYCCISEDAKGNKSIVENKLIVIAEKRAWDIATKVYKGDLFFIKALGDRVNVHQELDSTDPDVLKIFNEWSKDGKFKRKAKLYCDLRENDPVLFKKCNFIDKYFHQYYEALGRFGMEDLQWRPDYIRAAIAPTPADKIPHERVIELLQERFKEGCEYPNVKIKKALIDIYKELGITGNPSARDIQRYFTIKEATKRISGTKTATIQILSYWQKKITLFSSITSVVHPCEQSDIDATLDMIKNGNAFNLATRIDELRNTTDTELYDERKHKLPVATWNGIFDYRDSNGCSRYSSYTALDFDHIENITEFEAWLQTFPCVYAYFRTPSGAGVKAIVLHDNRRKENHDDLYDQLLAHFKCEKNDSSTSDLGRGNYLSYDPSLWINPAVKPFHYIPSTVRKEKKIKTQTIVKGKNGKDMIIEDESLTAQYLNKISQTILTDESIISMLNSIWNKKSVNERGRNSTVLSYAGVLCKAGVDKEKAKCFIQSLIPDLPEYEVTRAMNYAYEKNKFGCNRRKYTKSKSR